LEAFQHRGLSQEGVDVLYPYETLVIMDPRITEEEAAALLGRLQETFKGLGAQVGKVESWGKRRLTYEIRKQREGVYAVIEAAAEPAAVKEFERQLRLNEQVLRFVTTRVPVRKRARGAAKTEAPAAEEVV
jgi:small subunit ribosomal protein S6